VNQQWPYNPETPHGAWEYHEHLIPNSPRKPIRIWMEVGDRAPDLAEALPHGDMKSWSLGFFASPFRSPGSQAGGLRVHGAFVVVLREPERRSRQQKRGGAFRRRATQ
jgi:hypothetical protein